MKRVPHPPSQLPLQAPRTSLCKGSAWVRSYLLPAPRPLPMRQGKPLPGPHTQNKNPLQMPGFMQSSGPPSAQFPQPSLLPSASLQPLGSNNQPSYTALVNMCETAPPVFPQHLSHSAPLPKATPVHPQPSFLRGRGQCKAHSRVKLKLTLLCKAQKRLKANIHRRVAGGGVPQTSTEAETPSLISEVT